jgi:hypothetical protein
MQPQEMSQNEVWMNGSQIRVNEMAELKTSNKGSSPLYDGAYVMSREDVDNLLKEGVVNATTFIKFDTSFCL